MLFLSVSDNRSLFDAFVFIPIVRTILVLAEECGKANEHMVREPRRGIGKSSATFFAYNLLPVQLAI